MVQQLFDDGDFGGDFGVVYDSCMWLVRVVQYFFYVVDFCFEQEFEYFVVWEKVGNYCGIGVGVVSCFECIVYIVVVMFCQLFGEIFVFFCFFGIEMYVFEQ